MQIVGVVADFNQESIHAAITPLAILTSTDYNLQWNISHCPETANSKRR